MSTIAAQATDRIGDIAQTLAVVVIVSVFAWRGLKQLLPSVHRRIVQRLRRLVGLPVDTGTAAGGSGCDSGCGTCNNCGTSPATQKRTEAPLQFTPRRKR